MKRKIYISSLFIFITTVAFSQKILHHHVFFPQGFFVVSKTKTENKIPALFVLPQPADVAIPKAKFISLFTGLPVIKLMEPVNRKKPVLLTELCFGEIAETIFEQANSSLLNTYDDTIPELFKDAPFSVKITCIIRL